MTVSDVPDVERVMVVGAGVMGAGIAQALALGGVRVMLTDHDPAALAAALRRIADGRHGLSRGVALGKLERAAAENARSRIETYADRAEALAADPELVLECVWEDFGLKTRIFRELDREAPPSSILASNTSGFSITALSGATSRPERVIGWHWASPAPIMRLAEIVAHAHTSPAVVSAVCALARRCGKNPVVIQDSPTRWGFVGSRLFMALHREAQAIVAEGVASPDAVDAIVRDTFRWPAGPFETVKHAATGWDPDVNPSRGHPGTSISRNAQLMGLDTTRGQD